MLPTISLGHLQATRLIVSGNPFNGHFPNETLLHCEKCGINTMLLQGDIATMQLVTKYRQQGGTMHWIAITCEEDASYDAHIDQIASFQPDAICHDSTVTDRLFLAGKFDELKHRIDVIKGKGLPVGLGTNIPEVIHYVDEHGWDVDFYAAGIFNLSQTGRDSGGNFDELDVFAMYRTICQTPKPCIAFHVLAAGRRCRTTERIWLALYEAYFGIKNTDAVAIATYSGQLEHITDNVKNAAKLISSFAAAPGQGKYDGLGKKTILVPNSIPSYWDTALDTAINKFKDNQAKSDRISSLIFVTDMHWEHNTKNTVPLINALKERTGIRRVIFGGDIIQGQPALYDARRAIADWVAHMNGLGRDGWYAVRGNHDNNACWGAYTSEDVWTDDEYYDHVLQYAKNANTDGTKKIYNYVDDADAKIRYYFLDNHSSGSTPPDPDTINMVPFETQLSWLKETALELSNDWGIVVVQHRGFSEQKYNPDAVYTAEQQKFFATIPEMGEPTFDEAGHFTGPFIVSPVSGMQGLCEGYCRALMPVLNEIALNENAPEVIAVLTGHTHWDASLIAEGGYPVTATTCDAGCSSSQYDLLCPYRTPGTDWEQLMDIVQIDRANRKLYFTRLGPGVDREFSY